MLRYEIRKKKIGERIKALRKEMGWTPKEFLQKIYMSEQSHKTLTAWEAGERLPDLTSLVRMADLFKCDVGHLLCDYDEPTRDIADAANVTGLSGPAVAAISSLDSTHFSAIGNTPIAVADTLSKLCENKQFYSFLHELSAARHYSADSSFNYEDFIAEIKFRLDLDSGAANGFSQLTQQQWIDLVYPLNKYMGAIALDRRDMVEHRLTLACDILKSMAHEIIDAADPGK